MEKLIRKPVVMEIIGLSGATIDRLEKAGQFPVRVQLSKRAVAWAEQEITDWLASRQRRVCRG